MAAAQTAAAPGRMRAVPLLATLLYASLACCALVPSTITPRTLRRPHAHSGIEVANVVQSPRLQRPRVRKRIGVANVVYPPDNYHREAMRLVANLKGNAALLAAFSFSALTARDLPGNDSPGLQQAYVLLACLTLALELVAVYVGQQLMYRMSDGSFGAAGEDGEPDTQRSILSILLLNYRDEFYTVRASFFAGICTMMGAIAVRAWAVYEPPLASAVTLIFVCAGALIGYSNRDTGATLERVRLLDTQPSSLDESFQEADSNGDGRLCADEIGQALRRCGLLVSEAEAEELMARCGSDDGIPTSSTTTLDLAGFTKLVGLLNNGERAAVRDERRI